MRVPTNRLILFSLLLVVLFISGPRATSYPSDAQEVAAQQPVSIMPSRFTGQPEFKYFGDRDETLVQVFIPLSEPGNSKDQSERLGMYVRFGVAGKKVTQPKNVTIEFRSESSKPLYKKDDARRLAIILNGQKYLSATMALISTKPNSAGTYSESMMRAVAYGTFQQISMAREIRVSLGSEKFDLTRDQINALVALARTIEP